MTSAIISLLATIFSTSMATFFNCILGGYGTLVFNSKTNTVYEVLNSVKLCVCVELSIRIATVY